MLFITVATRICFWVRYIRMNSNHSLFQESSSLVREAQDALNQLSRPSGTLLSRQQLIAHVSTYSQQLTNNLSQIELTNSNDMPELEKLKNDTLSIQREFFKYQQETDTNRKSDYTQSSYVPHSNHTIIEIDDELSEHQRLTRVQNSIFDMIDITHTSRSRIKAQDDLLKNVEHQFLSIFSKLGLSSTVLRLISQRIRGDKIIFIAGVSLVLIIIFIFVFII